MPTVPTPGYQQTNSAVSQAYSVESVTNAGAPYYAAAQGLQQISRAMDAAQERVSTVKVNDARAKTTEGRNTAEMAYGKALAESTDPKSATTAFETFQSNVEKVDAEASQGLQTEQELQAWKEWSRQDGEARRVRATSKFLGRQDDLNKESTAAMASSSAATYLINPSDESRAAFDTATDASIKAQNLSPAAAKLQKDLSVKQLHNTAVARSINDDNPLQAINYLDTHKDEMDPVTWGELHTQATKQNDKKVGTTVGQTAALQSEYVDPIDNRVRSNPDTINELMGDLTKDQQEVAKEQFRLEVQRRERVRNERADNLYSSYYSGAEDGSINPYQFTPDKISTLKPEQYDALKNKYDQFLGREAQIDYAKNQAQRAAESPEQAYAIHLELDSLSSQDAQRAEQILNERLAAKVDGKFVRSLLTESDYKGLIDHARSRVSGESTAPVNDIVTAYAEVNHDADLMSGKTDPKKWIKDNPGLINFVHDRTRGVSKNNLPQVLRDSVTLYSLKTRDNRTVGDVLGSNDMRQINAMEVDWSKDEKNTLIDRYNLRSFADRVTPDTLSRVLTQKYVREYGALSQYKMVRSGGRTVRDRITTGDLLTGATITPIEAIPGAEIQTPERKALNNAWMFLGNH